MKLWFISSVAAATLTISSASAQQVTDIKTLDPAKFDIGTEAKPKDQILSAFEQAKWISALDRANGKRGELAADFYLSGLDNLLERQAGRGAPIALSSIKPYKPRYCDQTTKPILRSSVSKVNILSCENFQFEDGGATFSYTDDGESNQRAASFKFGLAFPFGSKLLEPADTTRLSATERAFALYFEGDGTLVQGGPNKGTLETGLLAGWRFERLRGGNFGGLSLLNVQPYIRTDTDFDARIYGLKASYTPVKLDFRLGGQKVDSKEVNAKNAFFWTLRAEAEGLHVDEAGSTSLTSGDSSLWMGVVAGLVYTNQKVGPYGIKAKINGEYRVDTVDGTEAELATASLDFFLDEKQKTSLQLSYTKGTMYQDLSNVDQFGASFSLKF